MGETKNAPEMLPEEFLEIWRVLREADERATSRQALARELGVGTHTLQRILVRGDVPSFSRAGTRETRAWIRTLARLAVHFGRDPRDWLTAVGIGWEPAVREVAWKAIRTREERAAAAAAAKAAARTAARVASRGASRPVSETASDVAWGAGPVTAAGGEPGAAAPEAVSSSEVDPLADIERADQSLEPFPVQIGIADFWPFCQPPLGSPRSFFQRFAERLIGSIDPSWRIQTRIDTARNLARALTGADPRPHLSIGLFDTVPRRRSGIGFLPIPGFRVRLAAIHVRQRGSGPRAPTWEEATSPGGWEAVRFLVIAGEPGGLYLEGQCGCPRERLLLRSPMQPDRLAEELLQEVRRRANEPVVLVTDELSVLPILGALERQEGFSERFSWEELSGARDDTAGYLLSVAVPPAAARWRKLLETALERDLFGTAALRTARLYASTLAEAAMTHLAPQLAKDARSRRLWRLSSAELATPAFRRAYVVHLVERVEAELHRAQGIARGSDSHEEMRERTRARLTDVVSSLVPQEWGEELAAALPETAASRIPKASRLAEARRLLEEAGRAIAETEQHPALDAPEKLAKLMWNQCQSCSVSLEEFHGASDRYCRFCSDEQGRLRPREEVLESIAHWVQDWQEGVSPQKARDRARRFMSAMPAWADDEDPEDSDDPAR